MRPRCVRIRRTTRGSSIVAITRMRPPQFGQASTSTANTLWSSSAQRQRRGGPAFGGVSAASELSRRMEGRRSDNVRLHRPEKTVHVAYDPSVTATHTPACRSFLYPTPLTSGLGTSMPITTRRILRWNIRSTHGIFGGLRTVQGSRVVYTVTPASEVFGDARSEGRTRHVGQARLHLGKLVQHCQRTDARVGWIPHRLSGGFDCHSHELPVHGAHCAPVLAWERGTRSNCLCRPVALTCSTLKHLRATRSA
jgi:hypothetical protein